MIILTLLTRLTLSFDLLFIPLLSFPNSRHSYKTQSFTSMSIIDSRTSHMRFLISINNILTRISISHLKSTQILITMINRSNQINYISSGLPILTHQYILTQQHILAIFTILFFSYTLQLLQNILGLGNISSSFQVLILLFKIDDLKDPSQIIIKNHGIDYKPDKSEHEAHNSS